MRGHTELNALLAAVKLWHSAVPEAAAFHPWPDDLSLVPHPPRELAATARVAAAPGVPNARSTALLHAVQAARPYLHWQHGYTAAQVGAAFLEGFCWCELAGAEGHFRSGKTRATLAYWGPGLYYDWHHHRAEELYTVIAGRADFHARGLPDVTLGPGQTRYHASRQPHAMTTTDSPVLTLVFWRGNGLSDMPDLTS